CLSYWVHELTLYKEEEKYSRFGLQMDSGYLNYIENRLTTFARLYELIMAAEKMVIWLQDSEQYTYLLEELDITKFYRALEKRAHYLLNGHFWPEYAMYFANPQRILGSFFIRHHAFRVRIDDVEHYLSGFVAYLKYLQLNAVNALSIDEAEPSRPNNKVIGVLGYPRNPTRFTEVKRLAQESQNRGLSLFYMSYADIHIHENKSTGYLYETGKWKKTVQPIPQYIDNAPANTKEQKRIYGQLGQNAQMLCQSLGGKRAITEILNRCESTKGLLIPTQILCKDSLFDAIDRYGKVVLKPSRSNRGRNIYCVSTTNHQGMY